MIGPCERFEELWLDYLYGLLDAEQCRELESHLPHCPTCQSALAEAKACQARLAVAARAVAVVPEFTRPEDEPAPFSLVAEPVAAATAVKPPDEQSESRGLAPLPTLSFRPRRSLARRLWPVWSAAAALLVAVVGGGAWHRQGLNQREQAVANAKREVLAVEARLEQLHKDANRERQTLEAAVDAEPVRVEVVGPAATQPGAPFTANVATRGLDGQPRPAELDVKVVTGGGDVLHREKVASRGAAQVAVPGGWKAQDVRLEVLAKNANETAVVRESLQVQPVSHLLHVALNKSVFQPGEVIFMRALALERFSLKPAQKPLPLRFALCDAQGREVLHTAAATGPGGIASAGLAVVPTLPAGQYSVQVAGDAGDDFEPQRRSVEIVPQLGNVEVFADRDNYRGGENMKLTVDVRAPDGRPIPNQALEVQPRFNAGRDAGGRDRAAPPPLTARTDAQGRANVEVPLPATLESAQIDIEVQARAGQGAGGFGGGLGAPNLDAPNRPAPKATAPGAGKKKETAKKLAPLAGMVPFADGASARRFFQAVPSRLEVDFYPEGGDLVAGVPQRVYYRVRSPLGEPVRPEGQVVVLAGKQAIYTSQSGQGAGVFRLAADPKERYTVRVTGPMSVTEIRDPFKALGIRSDGIVLTAPRSVVEANAPLTMGVHNRGAARKLALVVQCRGQIVTQDLIDISAGSMKVGLALPAEVAGVLRVTAYEQREGRLEPLAERLVYRAPTRRLDLKVAVQTRKTGAASADKTATGATLGIEARDEAGKAAPAWTTAIVAEDRHRLEANELSLAEHFLIAAELGPDAELDDLAALDADSPEARAALDVLLGVYGWRRFVPRQTDPVLLAQQNGVREAEGDRGAEPGSQHGAVALFRRESGADFALRADAKERARADAAALEQRTAEDTARLREEQRSAAEALAAAQEARDTYARLPGEYYRLTLGVLVVASFGAACLLMIWGLLRAARRRGPAAPSFAGAIAALAVCLVIYIGLAPGIRVEGPVPRADDVKVAMQDKKSHAPVDRDAPTEGLDNADGKVRSPEKRSETERSAPRTTPKPDMAKPDMPKAPKSDMRAESKTADPATAARAPAPPPSAQAAIPAPPSAKSAPVLQAQIERMTPGGTLTRPVEPAASAPRRDQARGMVLPLEENMDRARGKPPADKDDANASRSVASSEGAAGPVAGGMSGYAADPALARRYATALDRQKAALDAVRTMPMPDAKGAKKDAGAVPGDVPALTPPAPGMPSVLMESGEVAREFAYRHGAAIHHPPTLLWHPALRLSDGRAKLDFDLPAIPATYRILIYGHTEDGRLGFFEDRLNTGK
jgi:hypothetical protein